jgi:hypothetical protein
MKLILIASTTLALAAGVASAANERPNERPDSLRSSVTVTETREVTARSIYSPEEQSRWNLAADDIVHVTIFPSPSTTDKRSRDDASSR